MHSLALLPALLLATPTIEGASAQLTDGQLNVEVTTSEPMARDEIRTKLDGKVLSIYAEGAKLGGKRSFGEGQMAITALPRSSYAKLELPVAAELGCSGPIAVKVVDAKITASVKCTGNEAAPAPAPASVKQAAKPVADKPVAADNAPAPAVPAPEKKTEAVAAPAPAPAVEASAPKQPAGKPSKKEPAADPAAALKTPTSPSLTLMLFLGMAGVAGYLIWRKKKQARHGLIKILETASIGPKRSIVIAEINGERMILGTSEAGISLLNGAPGGHFTGTGIQPLSAALAAATQLPDDLQAPAPAPQQPSSGNRVPEATTDGESNALARLFQRRSKAEATAKAAEQHQDPSTMAEDFRDLLEDSLEDEELRRRLATGVRGRTS